MIVRVIGGSALGATGVVCLGRRAPRFPGDRYGRGGGRYPTAGRAGSGRDDGGRKGCDGSGRGPPRGGLFVGVRGVVSGTWRSALSATGGRGLGLGSSTRSRNVGGTKRPVRFVTVDVAALNCADGVCSTGVRTGGVPSGSRAAGGGVTGAGGGGASTVFGGGGASTVSGGGEASTVSGGGEASTVSGGGEASTVSGGGEVALVLIAESSATSVRVSVAVEVSAVASMSTAACFAALADLMSLGGPS